MPLEPYRPYQPTTPEATPSPRRDGYGHGRNISDSTWSTPDSDQTYASATTYLTTPNASPQKPNAYNILPKIRTQDQSLEPEYCGSFGHRRAQSHDVDAQTISLAYRPNYQRSTTSPPEFSTETVPLSDNSTWSPWNNSAADSSLTFSYNGYESFGHGRSISAATIDTSRFRSVGNTHYRTLPVFRTQESIQFPTMYSDSMNQSASYQTVGPLDVYPQELPAELNYLPGDDPRAVTTIHNYLTDRNPTIYNVPESARLGNGRAKHFWWDVRNIRQWDDFKFETISSIPVLSDIRYAPIGLGALPTPAPLSSSASRPQDLSTLAYAIRDFHIAKVNAALKSSTLGTHMKMTLKTTAEDGPYFVSNLANESEGTLGSRGKVVGLVKPYERWNSGKHKEVGQKRVEYLQHLAHLQALMRKHNCRYGFIISEIELVCVRLGTNTVPNFGYLERSRGIAMTTWRNNMNDTANGMTVCQALWYLNVLARDGPGLNQPATWIDVGPPEAHTRARVLAKGIDGRDNWMPKVQMHEMRQAKSIRGWIWPEDPVHRQKEGVGSARTKRR